MTIGSRRSHPKSRMGCGQCKRRRVKCDFNAPICSNCWKRDEICDYQQLGLTSKRQQHLYYGQQRAPRHPGSISQLMPTRPPQAGLQNTGALNDTCPRLPSSALPQQPDAPTLSDPVSAYLMRHFVERTSLEFDLVTDNERIWQCHAVKASVEFPFLQHALMAISSLHVCHTNPASLQRYYYAGCQYFVQSSKLFRAEALGITKQNWQPILTYLIASIIFNLDVSFLARKIDGHKNTISPASMLQILRAPGYLSNQVGFGLLPDSFAAILVRRKSRPRAPPDENVILAVRRLKIFCDIEPHANPDAQVYSDAVASLINWAVLSCCRPRSWDELFAWPVAVSIRYIEMLKSEDDFAKVIFVYWCAIMNRAPGRYYLHGVMREMEELATTSIAPKWHTLLEWPRKELQIGATLVDL